jgi:hypothetical protein
MSRRDDEDTAPRWAGRPSEPTRVGLGELGIVAGSRARNGDTPPSGTDISGPVTPPRSIAARIAKLEGLTTDEQIVHAYAAAEQAAEEAAQAKAAAGVAARASHRTERAAERLDERVGMLHKDHETIVAKHDGQRRELRALRAYMTRYERDAATRHREVVAAMAALPDHSLELGMLRELVGQPPQSVDIRASIVEEMTAQQIADMREKGTGLFRLFGQLAHVDRQIVTTIATAAGKAAGRTSGTITSVVTSAVATSPTWAPPLVEMLTKLFGG